MNQESRLMFIERLFSAIGGLIPSYMKNPDDRSISNGNVAVCIIDDAGQVYGKVFGDNKVRSRQSYGVAWTKASQVWITGLKTGEFEKKVYNNELQEATYGISKPDFIGWEGGQPIRLRDGTVLAAGFSGFRGVSDLDIVVKAIGTVDEK